MGEEHYRPGNGLLRLTWPQIEAIQAKYARLWVFVSEQGDAEARLILVVKKGKVRFVELESSVENPNGHERAQLPWSTLQMIDAKLSSLCGLTEQTGGEARLALTVSPRGEIQMRMVVSEELSPARN